MNKPRIVGIPGIRSDGTGNINLLLGEFDRAGYETLKANLPIRSALTARWCTKRDAKKLLEITNPGDILVAHSRGCLVATKALEIEPEKFPEVWFFRPAMSAKKVFKTDTKITCVFSEDDLAIQVGSLLINHPFGKAGNKGFTRDLTVRNLESFGRHSEDFQHTPYWFKQIVLSLSLGEGKKT